MGALKELIKHFKDGGYEKDVAGLQEISDRLDEDHKRLVDNSKRLDRLEQQAHSHAPSVTIADEVVPESTIYTQDERSCDHEGHECCKTCLYGTTPVCIHDDVCDGKSHYKAQEQFAKADEVDGDRREAQEQGVDVSAIYQTDEYGNQTRVYSQSDIDDLRARLAKYESKEQGGDDCWHCAKCGMPDLRARLLKYEELEASCCPEDVGFDEYIKTLRARLTEVEKENAELKRDYAKYKDDCIKQTNNAKVAFDKLYADGMEQLGKDSQEAIIKAVDSVIEPLRKENDELKRQLKSEVKG